MPIFEFDDHIEPVTIKIGVDTFEALPAIPADDFADFMNVFRKIPPLVDQLQAKDDDDTGNATERNARKFAAYEEFLQISMDGLQLVLTPAGLDAIKERAKSKDRPIPITTLAAVFSRLAGFYMGGGKEAEDTEDVRPTEDGSESLPSSATTGGSSEDNSFSEDAVSDSGPTTT